MTYAWVPRLVRWLVLLPALGLVLWPTPAVAVAAATWAWPLGGAPQVVRGFAPGPSPWSPGHRGVDLAGTPGQAVHAAGAGAVTYAGVLVGRGVVTVSHGALRTTYEPVTTAVRVGQRVVAGDVLGRLDPGHVGCPAVACLHWGVRRGDDYLDPVALVGRAEVRLLPVGPPVRGLASGPATPRAALPAEPRAGGLPPPISTSPAPAHAPAAGSRSGPPLALVGATAPARPPPSASPPGRGLAVAAVLGGGVLVLGQSARRWRG